MTSQHWAIFAVLATAAVVLMIAERLGAPVTLTLNFKGDIKRESRWFAQYGQAVCTVVAGILVWQLDPARRQAAWVMMGGVLAVSLVCTVIKRLLGRVRPARENAGKFLGPSWKHANYRESFPSSHSACAIALTVFLAHFYPPAALTFWTLAIICAVLRYLLDAHWPSDVAGGVALGYLGAHLAIQGFGI